MQEDNTEGERRQETGDVYIAQVVPASGGEYTQCYVGQASGCTVKGLDSGKEYWFRVCALGAAGEGPWSDRAAKRAT
jgi:hypothetical protein